MNRKQYQARKIALTDSEERVYVYGWNDALELAASLLMDLKQPNLATLIKAVGSAKVDEQGKVINED